MLILEEKPSSAAAFSLYGDAYFEPLPKLIAVVAILFDESRFGTGCRKGDGEMVQRVPMSKTGHQRLREELTRLERFERMEVIKSIEVAWGHGDLKENAEYHAAKERQGHIEGRIMDLKDKLGRAEVIDCTSLTGDRVVFGTMVSLVDLDTDVEVQYTLLGPDESDVKTGSISVLSPIGRGLIGKVVGDDVTIQTPGGARQFEILGISPATQP